MCLNGRINISHFGSRLEDLKSRSGRAPPRVFSDMEDVVSSPKTPGGGQVRRGSFSGSLLSVPGAAGCAETQRGESSGCLEARLCESPRERSRVDANATVMSYVSSNFYSNFWLIFGKL